MKSSPSLAKFLIGLIFCLAQSSCTGLSLGSDILIYKGRIITGITPVDTTIQIYASSRGRPLFENGKIRYNFIAGNPDTAGFFFSNGTTPQYGENEDSPPQWEGGPIEIFITHPSFKDYHDTLSIEELKPLPQITPEAAGIKLKSVERGVWVFPDIHLVPK